MKILIMQISFVVVIMFAAMPATAYNLEIKSVSGTGGGSEDIIFVDIVFAPDSGGNMFGDYGFNVYYDYSEMSWNSTDTILMPPAPLNVMFQPFENASGSGMINGISSLVPFSSTSTAMLFQPVTLARLAFNSGNTVQDGAGDVWIDTLNAGTGFTVDGHMISSGSMPVSYSGTDIYVSTGGVTAAEPAGAAMYIVGTAVFLFGGKLKAGLKVKRIRR